MKDKRVLVSHRSLGVEARRQLRFFASVDVILRIKDFKLFSCLLDLKLVGLYLISQGDTKLLAHFLQNS
jgi:hypothetical protein